MNIPVAAQTYTLRDELNKDYAGTLEKVAHLGFNAIELGGFGPYTVDEWNSILGRLHMSVISNHIQLEMLEESFNHIAEFNLAIGNHRLICPYLREERRFDAEDYKRTAESLNSIGRKCMDNGIEFFYHNHAFEFTKYGDQYGLDILIERTDPQLVRFELDTCWVKYGGEDPAQYIRKCKNRCQLIHLKDLTVDKKLTFAEVGEGIVDFEGVFQASQAAGVEWFIIEQDVCRLSQIDSVKLSLENIQKIKQKVRLD
jgi:sugar phosphate isomerase/epimerase